MRFRVLSLPLICAALLSSCSDKPEEQAEGFWPWFESRKTELAKLFSYESGVAAQDDPALQQKIQDTVKEVGDKLREEHPEFYPYFGYAKGANELIITVHGQTEYFDAVDAFVASAPKIQGWTFIALKPPSPFTPTTEIRTGNVQLKAGDWLYSKSRGIDGTFDFVIYIPNQVSDDPKGYGRLFVQLITDALGERFASKAMGGIQVLPLTDDAPKDLLPFTGMYEDVSKAAGGQ